MLEIKEFIRDVHGVIVYVALSDDRKLSLEELIDEVKQNEVARAYVTTNLQGEKELHLTDDNDADGNLDSMTLI